jgi:hypothetical protein
VAKYSAKAKEEVKEAMHEMKEGKLKSGGKSQKKVTNPKQAIAIGLSKARRAGVRLGAPKRGTASSATRRKARRDLSRAGRRRKPSARRQRAVRRALKREPRSSASRRSLSSQARGAARRRSASSRSKAAKKAARTRKARSR